LFSSYIPTLLKITEHFRLEMYLFYNDVCFKLFVSVYTKSSRKNASIFNFSNFFEVKVNLVCRCIREVKIKNSQCLVFKKMSRKQKKLRKNWNFHSISAFTESILVLVTQNQKAPIFFRTAVCEIKFLKIFTGINYSL